MNELFTDLVNDFGQYLTFALQTPSEVSLCRVAIHSTSDLIRAIGPNFSKYMDQILPLIFKILKVLKSIKSGFKFRSHFKNPCL